MASAVTRDKANHPVHNGGHKNWSTWADDTPRFFTGNTDLQALSASVEYISKSVFAPYRQVELACNDGRFSFMSFTKCSLQSKDGYCFIMGMCGK